MNLTSKRMLQFIAGCAGVCALTASAVDPTNWVKDSFEPSDGSVGLSIAKYKMVVTGGGNEFTNFAWVAASGDSSTIVTNIGSYTGTRPITNAITSDLVLNLSTEGQTLTRNMGVTNNFVDSPVYVDTLIKFTPSEDTPTINDSNVKAAVFVNVSSNLVVYSGNGSVNVSTDVGYKIDPTRWYRLTILMGKVGDETAAFQVYVNDVLITNAVAITQDFNSNGTWFYSASAVNTISAVAFQGTGMVDDLVVTTLANGYGIPAAIALTLSFNDTLVSVTKGGTPVANSGTINSGDEIVIDAHDWYGITSVAGTTAVYGGATGARVNVSTGTVTAASAETVTIGVTQYSSGTVSTGAGSIDANKLSTWALAKGVSESALSGTAWYDDYLLNVGVGTDAKLKIASITVGESLATIVITTDKPGTVTSLAGINGTLKYYTTDSLGTAFSGATAISVTGAGTSVTTTVPLTAGKFIKATIE